LLFLAALELGEYTRRALNCKRVSIKHHECGLCRHETKPFQMVQPRWAVEYHYIVVKDRNCISQRLWIEPDNVMSLESRATRQYL
jgi:hypothetical protein